MKRFITIPIVIGLGACTAKQDRDVHSDLRDIEPFEIRVTDSDYSMAYGLEYVLTEKSLKVIFKGELEREKDSLVYSSELEVNETLKELSNLNLDDVQEYYSNPCIADGSQITVEVKKNKESKTVHLSNYYHNEIGLAIGFINELAPDKYRIWYDREKLLEDQKNCK